MKHHAWWLVALVGVVALLLMLPTPGARSSTLSRELEGLWTLRAYLEARGVDVELRDAPFASSDENFAASEESLDDGPLLIEPIPPDAILVLAFPWQNFSMEDQNQALIAHLRGGGHVLYAYSGSQLAFTEETIHQGLGLEDTVTLRSSPPLSPTRWWRYQQEEWQLTGAWSDAPPLRVTAFAEAPRAPADANVLYSLPAGDGRHAVEPLIFSLERHGGTVWVLPVATLDNAHLGRGRQADLVEALISSVPDTWIFDEYHHGLVRPELAARSFSSHAWDLFIAHALLLYILGVIAVGRRFGISWQEPRRSLGSTADFLRHLGTLHHQLGHHGDAAQRMLERALSLDPQLDSHGLDADSVDDSQSFVDFATALAARGSASHTKGPRDP